MSGITSITGMAWLVMNPLGLLWMTIKWVVLFVVVFLLVIFATAFVRFIATVIREMRRKS